MAYFLIKMGASDFLSQVLKKVEMKLLKELPEIRHVTYSN
jgi:hypothetical protein